MVKISNYNNHTWFHSGFSALYFHLDEAEFMSQTRTISGRLLVRRQKENNKGNMNQ